MTNKFQDILCSERENYFKKFLLPADHYKHYHLMCNCGTGRLGYNAYECEECGHISIHSNSCGDRSCPSCQAHLREEWIRKEKAKLLDIQYFHAVYTVPDLLNDLFLSNKKAMYNLLFRTSSDTMLEACKDKYGKIGFTSILHTWGSQMWFHPHIHMIVSGGGLSKDDDGNDIFVKSPANFLVSVKILSRLFRGKFLDGLKKLDLKDRDGKPIDPDDESYKSLISELYGKEWVVYTKEPFNNNQAVLNYIGRYSHRIAISNSRILSYDHDTHKVIFRYKDYKDGGRQKEMELDALEFIRRFFLHILPPRFIKIRHYGFMGNQSHKKLLKICRSLLNQPKKTADDGNGDAADNSVIHEYCCPECKGRMFFKDRTMHQMSVREFKWSLEDT